jgi:hypothetical protein
MNLINLLDFNQGLHPQIGLKYLFEDDILITPFFTEEYCAEIVEACKLNPEAFFDTMQINDPYPNYILSIDKLSFILLYNFINTFRDKLLPIINSLFLTNSVVKKIKTPYINRFTPDTQTDMGLHSDASSITIIIKLNNDFKGGSLNLPRQKFRSQYVPVGHAIIFPGGITHPHYVEKLITGERYTVVCFATPPEWDNTNVHIL